VLETIYVHQRDILLCQFEHKFSLEGMPLADAAYDTQQSQLQLVFLLLEELIRAIIEIEE
jgi:hypothetical protein